VELDARGRRLRAALAAVLVRDSAPELRLMRELARQLVRHRLLIAGITHQGETCSGPMPPEPSGSRLVICPMAGCAPHHVAVFGPSWRLVGSERTRPPQKSVGSGLVDTLLPPT
jgi:hypothetical protein